MKSKIEVYDWTKQSTVSNFQAGGLVSDVFCRLLSESKSKVYIFLNFQGLTPHRSPIQKEEFRQWELSARRGKLGRRN